MNNKKTPKQQSQSGAHKRPQPERAGSESIVLEIEEDPSTRPDGMMGALRGGLDTGVEKAKEAVETAKEAVAGATESAKETAVHAADRMQTMARDAQHAIAETGRTVVETARRNPMPAMLAGVGIACTGMGVTMLVRSARTERMGRERLEPKGQRRRKLEVQRAGRAVRNAFQDNPIAVGVAAAAAGTLIGLVIPSTRREDRWLGQGRDQVVQKAEEMAKRAMDKVDRLVHPTEQ